MKVCIIGAGGWGTAIASLLCENDHNVTLWAYEESTVNEINNEHRNSTFLPGAILPKNLIATNNPEECHNQNVYILAVPTQFIRATLSDNNFKFSDSLVVNVAKGIEQNSLHRVSQILTEVYDLKPERYIILTGPSHAEEVAKKLPTTVVAASEDHNNAHLVQKLFSNQFFRVYTSDDIVGCELGGSLKNVIAIAAGIIDGLEFGDNTKAALITRGLAEMSRLGITLGANPITFSGLSGLGDLYVTCSSKHSRNRFIGEQIGKGKTLKEIVAGMSMIAEGVYTTESTYFLGKKHEVELPIVEQVYNILFKNIEPLEAIKELMNRQYKREWWW